jgi:hypothetical protein
MNQTNAINSLLAATQAGEYQEKLEAERAAQKPWTDCGIEAKLERLRNEILGARHAVRWNNERHARNEEQLRRLQHHQHGGDGTVVIRVQDIERGYGECGQSLTPGFDPLA